MLFFSTHRFYWQLPLPQVRRPLVTVGLCYCFWHLVSHQCFSVVLKSFLGGLSSQEMRQKLISSRCCLLRTKGSMCPFWNPEVKKSLNTHISYYKCHLSRAATIHFLRNRYISQYKSHDTIHDTIHYNIQLTSDVMLLNCFGILNFHW